MEEGATSEIYIGETMDTMPMPAPPIILYTINPLKVPASAQPMAETENSTAERIITFFLPYLSAKLPAMLTPIIEPNKAQPTYQPWAIEPRENCSVTSLIVPEITAVS